MNEVEKMYENARVKYYESVCSIKRIFDTKFVDDCNFGINCYSCPLNKSPFTAEKQLELIKLLCTKRYIDITFTPEKEYYIFAYFVGCGFDKNFDEALAMFVNQYWNELSEEERKQIKEILE